jgi:2-methylcitrate dehydratase
MDTIASCLASYATTLTYDEIPPEVVHRVKALAIDRFACSLRGYTNEPSKIARSLAGRNLFGEMAATVWGRGHQSGMELATFANGVMIRRLELNDTYMSKSAGHPSDHFAPVMTCAEAVHAGGKETIVASLLAYEVFCRLCDRLNLSEAGFDHATAAVVSSVLGASRILGLSFEQTIQAVNIAVASNIALGQIRVGEVSMWKSCAVANAGRNAVFAALLAKEGMTGPSPIFEGSSGFLRAVGGAFSLEEFGGKGRPFRIMNVEAKQYPCGVFAQTAIEAALKARSILSSGDEIAEVTIGTCSFGKKAIGSDPEKWRPRNRETADHSLPYAVAVALVYGPPDVRHFEQPYLDNPSVVKIMQRTRVEVDEHCNRLFPGASSSRVSIVMRSGREISETAEYARGDLPDEHVEKKFHAMIQDLMTEPKCRKLLPILWELEQIHDMKTVIELLKISDVKEAI